jgi:hypothetical protein
MREFGQVSNGKKLWDLTWGLLLVCALTALSEWGPQFGLAKSLDQPVQAAIQSAPRIVK